MPAGGEKVALWNRLGHGIHASLGLTAAYLIGSVETDGPRFWVLLGIVLGMEALVLAVYLVKSRMRPSRDV